MLSLISKLMVTCLNDRMVNTHNVRNGAENSQGNRIRLHRQVWLKRLPRSLSPMTSRPSCCGSLLPTPPVVAMGQEMHQRQLRPPTATSRLRIRRSSPRQGNLLRPTTSFGSWSPSLGSCVALKCRRPSSPRNSCGVTLARGGPTTPPLVPRITKCRAHYIPAGIMRKKRQEFMDLK
jgi:hypothetical protein